MSADDRLAILDMIGRYSQAWDEKDADAYVALFTDDGVFELNPELPDGPTISEHGREQIRSWAEASHRRLADTGTRTRHVQSGTVFDELTERTARTRTMLISMRLRPGDSGPWASSAGVYTDEWRKSDEGWRIARRTLRHDGLHT